MGGIPAEPAQSLMVAPQVAPPAAAIIPPDPEDALPGPPSVEGTAVCPEEPPAAAPDIVGAPV
jgi:hypothetical protein